MNLANILNRHIGENEFRLQTHIFKLHCIVLSMKILIFIDKLYLTHLKDYGGSPHAGGPCQVAVTEGITLTTTRMLGE